MKAGAVDFLTMTRSITCRSRGDSVVSFSRRPMMAASASRRARSRPMAKPFRDQDMLDAIAMAPQAK